jgi:acylphosphatase
MRIRVLLYGGVQGVGFRFYARQAAHATGVAGYVRNRADGAVEVEAEGADAEVQDFRAALERGPPHARVQNVRELAPTNAPLPRPFTIER